ncbi:MAG TPA: polysaccharide pyruvyl transferase family protein, partial [Limnochordia bacterium]
MTYVLAGYYGFANPGDEAMLAALIGGIRTADRGAHCVVLSADPPATIRQHGSGGGVSAVRRDDPRAVWRALRQADLLIFGGGTLLQDVTGWLSPFYYLALIALARSAGCPVALHAQGFGPLRGRAARALAARWISACTSVSARDPDAAAALRDLYRAGPGRKAAEIAVVPDPAFALGPSALEPPAPHENGAG